MSKKATRRRLSDEEREERRSQERRLMADAVERLKSSEGWRRWLEVRRRFHDYSFHNQLLIAFQCPGATRVAGFRRWLSLGYAVRKGEKAIRIWVPCPPSKKALARWRSEGADPDDRPRTFFRMASVFDRSQVEPLPDFPGGVVELESPVAPITGDGLAHLFDPLCEFAALLDVAVVIGGVPPHAGGVFRPTEMEIGLQPISSEISPNQQVKTLIHELTHALVRCERAEDDPRLGYAEEEVVVECVAYSVCSSVGFDSAGFSVPYVASWSAGEEIERYAAMIDRLARRLEEVVVGVDDGRSGEPVEAADLPDEPGALQHAEVVADDRECLAA